MQTQHEKSSFKLQLEALISETLVEDFGDHWGKMVPEVVPYVIWG